MLSATFHDRGVGADDPDFSADLTWSTATIRTPEILYIICRNCYIPQGYPDSSFPYLSGNSPAKFPEVVSKCQSGKPLRNLSSRNPYWNWHCRDRAMTFGVHVRNFGAYEIIII